MAKIRKTPNKAGEGSTQKMMCFKADKEVVDILAMVANKGRLINNLVMDWWRSHNLDEHTDDTDPAWEQTEDNLK